MAAEDKISAIAAGWELVSHVCRTCLGRVLRNGERFRCASCGAKAMGSPDPICGCGIRIVGMLPAVAAPQATHARPIRNVAQPIPLRS